jgi:hypothetical protein
MWKILYEINTPKDRGELEAHKRSQKRSKTKKKEGTNSEMGHTVFACCTVSPHVEDTVRDQYSKG